MNPLITRTEVISTYADGFLVEKNMIEHYTNGQQFIIQLYPKVYHDRVSRGGMPNVLKNAKARKRSKV